MTSVVLVGTLDTKGSEYAFLRQCIEGAGCKTVMVDVGIGPAKGLAADIASQSVAKAAGVSIENLRQGGDRGAAIAAMSRGAAKVLRDLYADGRLDGVIALGGSGGSSIATAAMRALPIGMPKLMVSTIASGDVSPYVGQSDITMMYPVVDIAGINVVSERILRNAAAAIVGMASVAVVADAARSAKPVVAISMFGVTTPAADAARSWLADAGYEVLVFHANGAGGRAMEALIRDGYVQACLDLTTTELADELVGGALSAGADRLEAAGAKGIPQVVSLGALDMVNFGPIETVPQRFRERKLYRHNQNVTLMRTTAEECAKLGAIVARKLNKAKGPAAIFVPAAGVSSISKAGGVFFDPEADAALISSLRRELDPRIECFIENVDINAEGFGRLMAEKLHRFLQEGSAS